MATFLARLTIREDDTDTFEKAAAELHQLTHEREEDVLRYEYWRGSEPRTYYVFASFRDAEAFIAHQISDHHVELAGKVMMNLMEDFHLEWIDPIRNLADAPSTRPMKLSGNEDETTLQYFHRFPVGQPEWWSRPEPAPKSL